MESKKINYYLTPTDEEIKKDNDITIYQYMRLDYLFDLLEKQKYYAKRRYTFIDDNEKTFNLKDYFITYGTFSDPKYERAIETTKKEDDNCYITFKESTEMPVSCWTKKKTESFMMWKVYGKEMGVRIKSTVINFIKSINEDISLNSNNKILCGSIRYVDNLLDNGEVGVYLNKHKSYSDEKEFRFYLDFKDKDKRNEFILINIDPEVMIKEIMFSPFISETAAKVFTEIIKERYKITKVKQSKLKLK
jgi:hypothetical protein